MQLPVRARNGQDVHHRIPSASNPIRAYPRGSRTCVEVGQHLLSKSVTRVQIYSMSTSPFESKIAFQMGSSRSLPFFAVSACRIRACFASKNIQQVPYFRWYFDLQGVSRRSVHSFTLQGVLVDEGGGGLEGFCLCGLLGFCFPYNEEFLFGILCELLLAR